MSPDGHGGGWSEIERPVIVKEFPIIVGEVSNTGINSQNPSVVLETGT